jgi:hypothetical protein
VTEIHRILGPVGMRGNRRGKSSAALRAAEIADGYSPEDGPIRTHGKVGRPFGWIVPLITRLHHRGRRADTITSHQVGLGIEREMRIRLKDIQAAVADGSHRTEVQERQLRVFANYLLRYNEIGVSKELLADATSISLATVKRLLREARKARGAGIDPWTGELDAGDSVVRPC